MFTLIQNARVYAPDSLGKRDILVSGEKIAAIDADLMVAGLPGCRRVDVRGAAVIPGFVDGHAHLIGGGGEGGFETRTPEVGLTTLTRGGITTVVGLLGTDTLARHPETLYGKARGLTREGISAYMFTGGYQVPSPTITGGVDRDIAFVEAVLGVKVAIADHRCSHPTRDELARLASQARSGGLIGGKAGSVVVHLGNGRDGMALLEEVVASTDIPIRQFIPTHVNRHERLLEQAVAWGKSGGYMDFSTGIKTKKNPGGAVRSRDGIAQALDAGVSLTRICMSSDGNGSMPLFDETGGFVKIGIAGFNGMLEELKGLVAQEILPLERALLPATRTPAEALGLAPTKGVLAPGADADLVILDSNMNIDRVFARGVGMVEGGDPIVFGTFDPAPIGGD